MIRTKVQLRWNDIDMLGHLYNGVYQSLYDLGIQDYLIDVLSLSYDSSNCYWLLKATSTINYLSQITLDIPLELTTQVLKIGNKSVAFHQELINIKTREILSDSSSIMVLYNSHTKETERVLDSMRIAITGNNSI